MRKRKTLLMVLTMTVLVLGTASLHAEDKQWQVKGLGVFIDGGFATSSTRHDGELVRIEGDYGAGLYASLEYRPSPIIGIELGNLIGAVGTETVRVGHGYSRTSVESTGIGFSSLLLGLNIHLTPGQRIDVSVSPILGYVWFSSFEDDNHGHDSIRWAVGDELAWGGGLGIDIPVAESNWSVNITVKYLDTKIETSDRAHERIDTSFDPLVMGVGFGFKF